MAAEATTLMAVLGRVARLRGIPWDDASPLAALLPQLSAEARQTANEAPEFLCDALSSTDVFLADALRLLWPQAPALFFARVAAFVFAGPRPAGDDAALLVEALALSGVGEALRAGIEGEAGIDSTLAILAADCALAEWIAVTARLSGGLSEAFVTAELAAASERLVLDGNGPGVVERVQVRTIAGPLTHAVRFLLPAEARHCAEAVAAGAATHRLRSLGFPVSAPPDLSTDLSCVLGLRDCLAGLSPHSQEEVSHGDQRPEVI
jgi:hypothetical protein